MLNSRNLLCRPSACSSVPFRFTDDNKSIVISFFMLWRYRSHNLCVLASIIYDDDDVLQGSLPDCSNNMNQLVFCTEERKKRTTLFYKKSRYLVLHIGCIDLLAFHPRGITRLLWPPYIVLFFVMVDIGTWAEFLFSSKLANNSFFYGAAKHGRCTVGGPQPAQCVFQQVG